MNEPNAVINELVELANNYSPITDRLYEIKQEIERNNEITDRAVIDMQNTLSDCLSIAAGLSVILTGAGYEI